MKKQLFLALMLMMSLNIYSQKKYVVVYSYYNSSYAYLSGNIPSSMKSEYSYKDFGAKLSSYNWIGNLLNLLASEGFTLEQSNVTGTEQTNYLSQFILSKTDSNSESTPITRTKSSDEVREIARYNLQGLPVKPSDKGIQIIVYSNFTTKTVIVE